MTTRTDPLDALDRLSDEDQALVMAFSIVMKRIDGLPKADRDDLFELFGELGKAGDPEEVASIRRAMREILAQPPASVRVMADLGQSEALEKWKKYVGGKIRQAREAAGLTQGELAAKTGIPQSHLSRLENAEHSPTRKTLDKLAQAMGIPVEQLDPCGE